METNRRFAKISAELLARAGGALSLADAAEVLGMSEKNLHKDICSGQLLGLMSGDTLVVPRLQLYRSMSVWSVLSGVDRVTRLFVAAKSEGWPELQFLAENDPNLERAPIHALRDGHVEDVINAARAHLGLQDD